MELVRGSGNDQPESPKPRSWTVFFLSKLWTAAKIYVCSQIALVGAMYAYHLFEYHTDYRFGTIMEQPFFNQRLDRYMNEYLIPFLDGRYVIPRKGLFNDPFANKTAMFDADGNLSHFTHNEPEIIACSIRGGGMVNNRVKNKGTGGKSKVRRDPKPKAVEPKVKSAGQTAGAGRNKSRPRAPEDDRVDNDDAEEEEVDFAGRYPDFIYADPPRVQKTFKFDHADNPPNPGDGVHFEYDCLGAPFCGYVAIDIAMGIVPSPNNYEPHIMNPDNPILDGTFTNLIDYAIRRGANLVLFNRQFEVMQLAGVVMQNMNNPALPTVRLVFIEGEDIPDPDGGVMVPGIANGHYVLMCAYRGSASYDDMPALPIPRRLITSMADAIEWAVKRRDNLALLAGGVGCLAAGLVGLSMYNKLPGFVRPLLSPIGSSLRVTTTLAGVASLFLGIFLPYNRTTEFVKRRSYRDKSDHDRRDVISSRDMVDRQDSYATVDEISHHDYFGRNVYDEVVRSYNVSVSRFLVAYAESQSLAGKGRDPSLSVATIGSLRGVNTNASRPNIIKDTCDLIKQLSANMDRNEFVPEDVSTAYNSPPENIIVANQDRIEMNQIAGAGNKVLRYSLREPKRRIPVCSAPLGMLESDCGLVGPGEYPVTDSYMTLAAFVGRSMNPPPKTDLVHDFIAFSRRFVVKLCESVDFSELYEPDCRVFFRSHYTGKKSSHYIEATLSSYEDHLAGRAPKKFYAYSLFVKNENSAKLDEFFQFVKPRGIMVMSDLALVEQCPVLLLIDRFNHGLMSRFQVKDLSPEEMRRQIEQATQRQHNVTDYSSFESAVDNDIRDIEKFALIKLCERANFVNTKRAIVKHGFGFRILKTKWGLFRIGSRCSGDFWTSFGNGLVNLCLLAYCAYANGVSPDTFLLHSKAVVEGDDGITASQYPDKELLLSLGFKYSSEFSGSQPGDCDFLRSLWVDGYRILNIGRAMKIFFCRGASRLRKSKQLYLIRCAALSLYHSSPGHPVLTAVVNRILRQTVSVRPFKNYLKYLDTHNRCYEELQTREPIRVNEDMRRLVAKGAIGFPALSITSQLELEDRFNNDEVVYVGRLIDGSEDFCTYKNSKDRMDENYRPAPGQGCLFLQEFVRKLG